MKSLTDFSVEEPRQTVPELSVVILCYRAEELAREYVKEVVQELESERLDFELILVANYARGLKDSTPAIVKDLAGKDSRLKFVALEKQGMMGWDLRSGLTMATGKYIAAIDGDGQMPAHDLVRVYRLIETGAYDLVKTYRVTRNDGVSRWFISFMFNSAFRLLFWDGHFHDINSKPKIMTREAYSRLHLVSNDWFTDTEILVEGMQHDFRVMEIPTVFRKNAHRGSFVHITAIWEFVRNLIYYRCVRFPPFRKH